MAHEKDEQHVFGQDAFPGIAPPSGQSYTSNALYEERDPVTGKTIVWDRGRGYTKKDIYSFRFPWEINQPGKEFGSRSERLRPVTFDELRERQGQNLFQNLGAISRGEQGFIRRRDPVTGQPIERARGERNFNPNRRIPSFNISPNTINQQASAQRQRLVAGSAGVAGNRLGPRSGGAISPAINQGFGASFAGQSVALNDLQRTNIQTRLFGVQGQQDMLKQFRDEAGQRAGIGIRRGGLELDREKTKIDKEGQDLRAALEKRRLGILSFTAREEAAMARFDAYLKQIELQEKINKGFYEGSGGGGGPFGWVVDALKAVGGAVGIYSDYKDATSEDDDKNDYEGRDYEYV